MINRIMGFFMSYLLGLDPSRMPPWGVARRVGEGVEDAEAVTVLVVVTTEARMEDMAERFRQVGRGLRKVDHAVCRVVRESEERLCRCVQHRQKNIGSAHEDGGGEECPTTKALQTDGEVLDTCRWRRPVLVPCCCEGGELLHFELGVVRLCPVGCANGGGQYK
jgi:hypothetical protein